MARPLAPDEAALWARVMESVRPLRQVIPAVTAAPAPPPPVADRAATRPPRGRVPAPRPPAPVAPRARSVTEGTLDGGWDRRLARGLAQPDATVDLHGHTLHTAHALLDHALAGAIARGDRLVLLVTGKPPRPDSERPHARGAIRAALADWLAMSRHADAIAAVRAAHPRHGGAGAVYIVLRRQGRFATDI